VYLALTDAPAVVKTLAPFVTPEKTAKYDTCLLAAEALKRMGEFGRAVELLDKAVSHYGVNAVLLNSIGECYEGLGKTKEALAAFEKSLALSPDQPEVRKRAETLRKKAPL
jgi:Flp pilus assembly protein TadD